MVAELKSPLPDDVAQMVATLREMCWEECDSAAEMIERLAQQVPEGCVVVPRKPTLDMLIAAKKAVGNSTALVVWTAMIAAGEVKP